MSLPPPVPPQRLAITSGNDMHSCQVKFSIPGKGDIIWVDGYEDVNDLEIKELIVGCTIALASLQDEVWCRLGPRKSVEKERKDSEHLQYCQDNLVLCAKRIKRDGLSLDDLKQLTNEPTNEPENEAQTDQNRSLEVIKVSLGHMLHKSRDKYVDPYNELLWLLSIFAGKAVALLVKCSFGSRRVTILDLAQKAKLVKYARQKKDELFCAKLEEATRLGFSIDDLKSGSDSVTVPRKRKNEEIADTRSQRDANSPQGTQVPSPQNILLTSSSFEHHTLVDVPSIIERNQVPSITRAVVAPEPSAIPSDSNYLLLMFHFLGNCEIPYKLFERVRSSQYRWTNDGDQTQITALEAGLDQRLVDLLSDETRLTQAIDKLEPLVKRNMSTEGSWTCSIHSHSHLKSKLSQSLSEWTRDEWAIKFLKWICFVFPRDQFPSDPDQSLSVGKQLLPLVNLALSQATKILEDQPLEHLQVALSHQQSTLLRIVADWKQSEHSRVSYSPSPPQALLVSENLFYNIRVYFENSCRNMILDRHGTLLTLNGAKLHNNLCNDFDSYCFTATMLIEKGLHVEFRRALSKATALVGQILRAEHPRTLACFLEVFIHLIQTRLPGITSFLRDFIKRMSAIVTRKEHPWGQIYRLLGELDSESLEETMTQTWKCTTDTFDSEFGKFSPLAVSLRLDYVKRVYGITNYAEEERLLRDLLAQFRGIPSLSTPRVMLNLAHNLNKQGHHDVAEEMAWQVLSLLQNNEIYARRVVERIESLKIVSRSQYNQRKILEAEQTMRNLIEMIVGQWGRQHSWVLEFMNVLEVWLRGWGREEAANTLRGEIRELIGKDEIDEQLDGYKAYFV